MNILKEVNDLLQRHTKFNAKCIHNFSGESIDFIRLLKGPITTINPLILEREYLNPGGIQKIPKAT